MSAFNDTPNRQPLPDIRRRRPPQGKPVEAPGQRTYEVGYGRPPSEHQFKPGTSGNPRGRPRGARGINTMIREMLEHKVDLQVSGKRRKVTRIEALLAKQMELASRGDWRAIAHLIAAYRLARPDPIQAPPTEVEEQAATAADEEILAVFRSMLLEESAAKESRP